MSNTADAILERLARAGIDVGFGVYGGAIAELFEAFTRQDRIQYVCCQHEQACAFAAEGYAKTKGVPGFAFATSGPGGHNLVTGIANAYYDSVACIYITGNVSSKFMRPPDSPLRQLGFQESCPVDIVRPITKYAAVAMTGESALWHLEQALAACQSGRRGPVLLDIPIDVQRQ
jgi:acetolactate synthase-1/2/3 large subunit